MSSEDIFLQTKFIKSVVSLNDMPEDSGSEIAFCGRSNSGKSSVLNVLSQNKKLAKISKTPGRTQTINIYSVNPNLKKRIIDLPGYGYAKVSKKLRSKWGREINQYLNSRNSLKGLIIVMDIRHPFQESDLSLIYWSREMLMPIKILLNKADKISKAQVQKNLKKGKNTIKELIVGGQVQSFSSKDLRGLEELKETLLNWFKN